MEAYTLFLYLIVFVKVMYSLSVLLQFTKLLGWTSFSNEFYENNKERFENLYVLLMSILVILSFRNRTKGVYKFSRFEAELFFVFGTILICELFTKWYREYSSKDDSDVVAVTSDFMIPVLE